MIVSAVHTICTLPAKSDEPELVYLSYRPAELHPILLSAHTRFINAGDLTIQNVKMLIA